VRISGYLVHNVEMTITIALLEGWQAASVALHLLSCGAGLRSSSPPLSGTRVLLRLAKDVPNVGSDRAPSGEREIFEGDGVFCRVYYESSSYTTRTLWSNCF